MGENTISVFNDNHKDPYDTIITNRQYPPFGEQLDFNMISKHALNLCPTLIINNVNGSVIVKRNNSKNITEDTVKSGEKIESNEEESKSRNDLKKTQIKGKKTRIVEYLASQIPHYKGSTLSIDDLVKFVNGSDKSRNHLTNNVYNGKCFKKHKTIITNKTTVNCRQQNGSYNDRIVESLDIANDRHLNNIDNKIDTDCQLKTPTENVEPCPVVIGCEGNAKKVEFSGNNDGQNCVSEYDMDNDDFQVVKRKSRHKKVDVNSPAYIGFDKQFQEKRKSKKENVSAKLGNRSMETFSINRDTIMVNDKESLNLFISKLWMEFQSCYLEYIRDESKNIHETEGY